MKAAYIVIGIILFLLLAAGYSILSKPLADISGFNPTPLVSGELQLLDVPEGFHIEYYAQNITNARSMVLSESGTLFVGTRTAGNVYAVLDHNDDYRADEIITLASGLNMPNGVALKEGNLYVAEGHRVIRFDDIEEHLQDVPDPIIVNDQFPSHSHHGWKFIRFGPDGKLYVPVGAPCNVCNEGDPFATIMRMDADGTNLEVYARGIRNTVGFDWHPITKEMWFTDNGRDWWGDDVPPDELNHAPQEGLHFGFPYCHGDLVDDEYNQEGSCEQYTEPAQLLGPHVAALGMRFYTGTVFPDKYNKGVFIAEHGSWNRDPPLGYRIMFVPLEGDVATGYEPFIQGWLRNGETFGRPVDVMNMPDGSLLISDDAADSIYRVSYAQN